MTKVGDFTIKEGHIRLQSDIEYTNRMVLETLDDPGRPKPREKLTHYNGKLIAELDGQEKEDFYLSMQSPAMQVALIAQKERNPSKDQEWSERPIPENYLANPEARTQDEMVAKRELGIEETLLVEDIRRKSKNTRGQSGLSSVDAEKRTKGIEAFTYSKPAELTIAELKKVTKLTEMKSDLLESETSKKKGFWAKIFGGKTENKEEGKSTNLTLKGDKIVRKD